MSYGMEEILVAEQVINACRGRQWRLATAESCTGGLIAACLTEVAGASDVFDRGFVTYSNRAKIELLGVDSITLDRYGAVSEETAHEMCLGALDRAGVNLALSVTGIAGPSGGGLEKPIGLVYLGIAIEGNAPIVNRNLFTGTRGEIRRQSVVRGLTLMAQAFQAQ